MGKIKVGREKPRFYQPVGFMPAGYYAEEAHRAASKPSPEPQPGVAKESAEENAGVLPQPGPEKKVPSKPRRGKK